MTINEAVELIFERSLDLKMPIGLGHYPRKRSYFDQKSYMKCTYEQMIRYMQMHPDQDPLSSCEDFYDQLKDWRHVLRSNELIFMCTAAMDAAEDAIDLLRAAS